MANYTNVDDIRTGILRRGGEKTDGTSEFHATALEYINRAFLRILQEGIALPWTRKVAGVFNTLAKITAGTLAVTKGSTSITFSSAPASSVKDFKLRVDGKGPVYRIASHAAAATAATLDAAYVDDNNTAAAYVVFQDEYALVNDVLFLLTPLRFYESPYRLDLVDENAMEDRYPLPLIQEGVPTVAALIGEQRIRLSHYTADIKRVEYDYIQVLSDLVAGGTIPMPRPDRKALESGGLFYLMLDKEDTKADAAGLEFERDIGLMKGRHLKQKIHGSQAFGQIMPRLDGKGSRFREGPVRTASGLIIG